MSKLWNVKFTIFAENLSWNRFLKTINVFAIDSSSVSNLTASEFVSNYSAAFFISNKLTLSIYRFDEIFSFTLKRLSSCFNLRNHLAAEIISFFEKHSQNENVSSDWRFMTDDTDRIDTSNNARKCRNSQHRWFDELELELVIEKVKMLEKSKQLILARFKQLTRFNQNDYVSWDLSWNFVEVIRIVWLYNDQQKRNLKKWEEM